MVNKEEQQKKLIPELKVSQSKKRKEMIMVSNITYKLSCFADYSQLKYNKEDIITILKAYDNVILTPSIITEMLQNGEVSQRMQFSAQGGLLMITILSQRIDIQITSNDKNGFTDEDVSKVHANLLDNMKKILSIFGDRIADPYRLAWFTSYVYFELTDEEKTNFRNKFLNELEFFREGRLDDINVVYGARRNIKIADREERLNVLTTIFGYLTDVGTDEEVNGFRIDYDINTWQGNRKNRFTHKDIEEFISGSLNIQYSLNKEILP